MQSCLLTMDRPWHYHRSEVTGIFLASVVLKTVWLEQLRLLAKEAGRLGWSTANSSIWGNFQDLLCNLNFYNWYQYISIFYFNDNILNCYSAETFGYRINANGKSLRNKQVWTLTPSGDGESVILKSHLDRYVAVDQFGNVTCDQVSIS